MTTPSGTLTPEKIIEVRDKYQPLFRRQPNYVGNGAPTDIDRNGNEVLGITVRVNADPVDQDTLPPEDRIPDCLEGVPVKITEAEMMRID